MLLPSNMTNLMIPSLDPVNTVSSSNCQIKALKRLFDDFIKKKSH